MNLQNTLGSVEWLRTNEMKVKDLLPDTFTHIANLNRLRLGFGLKVLGIEWRSNDDLAELIVQLVMVGLLIREGDTVKRNPRGIFPEAMR